MRYVLKKGYTVIIEEINSVIKKSTLILVKENLLGVMS